jgi:phospholipid/cholesterol/gamma-HCH transport system substrate-binding protein
MKRRDEVLVGIFVTAAVIVAALGSLWLVRGGLAPGYALYSRFPWGAGVKQGQPVWLVGVTVGYIDDIDLDPSGSVVVKMRIEKAYDVPKGTTAALVANGLFGDQAVDLKPAGPNPDTFAPGDTIPIRPAQAGIALLTQRADTVSAALSVLMGTARAQLVDSGGLAEVRRALVSMNRLVAQLATVANVQSAELQATIATARNRIAAVDSAQVDTAVRSMRTASENLSRITARLDTTANRVNALLAKSDSAGTVGRLLRDPALYDSLRTLLGGVHTLLDDLKKNPRKYINLRIF